MFTAQELGVIASHEPTFIENIREDQSPVEISVEEIRKPINKADSNKLAGRGNINPRAPKECKDEIGQLLTRMCYLSLESALVIRRVECC